MKRSFQILTLVAVMITVVSLQARAALQVAATFGATNFFCADNTPCDQNPALGTIAIADQNIGGIQVNGSIQVSQKGSTNILNTSSLSAINTTAGSLAYRVTVGDTGFIGPVTSFSTSGSGVFQEAIGSTADLGWWDDPTNTQGADDSNDTPGSLIDSFSKTVTLVADSFSHNGSGAVNDLGLFSMTEQISGIITAGGQLLNRGQTEIKSAVASEPATLALLGGGLIMLSLVRRRRRVNAFA